MRFSYDDKERAVHGYLKTSLTLVQAGQLLQPAAPLQRVQDWVAEYKNKVAIFTQKTGKAPAFTWFDKSGREPALLHNLWQAPGMPPRQDLTVQCAARCPRIATGVTCPTTSSCLLF